MHSNEHDRRVSTDSQRRAAAANAGRAPGGVWPLVAWLLVALSLPGCRAAPTAQAEDPPKTASQVAPLATATERSIAAPPRFAFDWAPPCRVPVHELSRWGGDIGRKRYSVVLDRDEEGTLRVRREDLVFLDAQGKDIPWQPGEKEKLEASVGMATIMPTFWVTPRGNFVRSEAFDQLVARMRATGATAAEQQAVSQSNMRELLDMNVAQSWTGWVEAWLDWPLRVGESRESNVEQTRLPGLRLPAQMRQEFLGMDGEFARLQQTTQLRGAAAGQAIVHFLNETVRRVGGVEMPDDALRDSELTARAYVETRPGSLQPRLTRSESSMLGKLPSGEELHIEQYQELRWAWEHAEGCRSGAP